GGAALGRRELRRDAHGGSSRVCVDGAAVGGVRERGHPRGIRDRGRLGRRTFSRSVEGGTAPDGARLRGTPLAEPRQLGVRNEARRAGRRGIRQTAPRGEPLIGPARLWSRTRSRRPESPEAFSGE